jgi:hypothetical protein
MSDIRLKKITIEPLQSPLIIQKGDVSITNTTFSTDILNASLIVNGGISINTTHIAISSTCGGALTIGGGVGIMKNVYIGNDLNLDSSNGVFRIAGLSTPRMFLDNITNKNFTIAPDGANVRFRLTDTNLHINVTSTSSSSTTGGLIINGGISIACTQDTLNASNGGSLTVAGGVAIGKNVEIAQSLTLGESNSNNSGLNIRYTGKDQIVLQNNSGYSYINTTNEDLTIFNNKDIEIETSSGNIHLINDDHIVLAVYSNGTESFDAFYISNNDSSINSSSGCLLLEGGQSIRNSTDATSTTSGGALTILGGLGISKKTYMGDSLGLNVTNDKKNKLVLYTPDGNLTQSHDFSGLGSISSGSIIYQVSNSSANHIFYSGSGLTSSDEIFKICGNRDIVLKGKDQSYRIIGGGFTNDSLSFESMSGISDVNFYSHTGNNSNTLKIFANGTSQDITNSELLNIGWDTLSYKISSQQSGTGSLQDIIIESGIQNQLVIKNDGSIIISSTEPSSSINSGAFVLNGGISINTTANAINISQGGALTIAGGASINKDIFIGNNVYINNVKLHSDITSTSHSNLVINSKQDSYPQLDLQAHSSINSMYYSNRFTLYSLGTWDSNDKTGLEIKTKDDISGYDISTVASGTGNDQTISIYTNNNSDQIFLDISGKVGINTNVTNYNLDVNGTLGVNDRVHFTSSVNSVNSTTASFIIEGGVSVASTKEAESLTRGGALTVAGGVSIQKNVVIGGITEFLDTTPSTSSLEGAVIINGGLSIKSGENSVDALNGGALTIAGGTSISGDLYVGGSINGSGSSSSTYAYLTLTATDEAVNLSTGTLLSLGGLTLQCDTDAISISNGGSILTPGGASIGKNVFLGGDIYLTRGITNYYTEDTNIINFYDNFNINRFSIDRDFTTQIFSITRYDSSGDPIEKSFEIYNSDGHIIFNNQVSSSNKQNASVIFKGGISVSCTENSSSLENGGSLTIGGGASIAKNTFIGGNVTVYSTKESNDVSSGAVIISGGVGISGNLNVLGNTLIVGNLTVRGQTTTIDTSNTSIKDNVFLLNSGPSGSSDSGFVIQRYQNDNDTNSGDVIADLPHEIYTLPDQTGMTSVQLKLTIDANALNNYYNGWWIKIASGFSSNQIRKVIAYDGNTKIITLSSAFTNQNPSLGDAIRLYNKPYVGLIYNETLDRFEFGATVQDPNETNILLNNKMPICFSSATSVSTEVSNSVSSGALLMTGGLSICNTQDASSVTSGGTITSLGGASINKSLYVGTNLYVNGSNMTPSPYDMFSIRTFNANNNQNSFVNITGLQFDPEVSGFDVYLSAILIASNNLYVNFHIRGINKLTSWEIVKTYVGDDTGIQFHITDFGQLQYTTPSYNGFVSLTFKWRALTT